MVFAYRLSVLLLPNSQAGIDALAIKAEMKREIRLAMSLTNSMVLSIGHEQLLIGVNKMFPIRRLFFALFLFIAATNASWAMEGSSQREYQFPLIVVKLDKDNDDLFFMSNFSATKRINKQKGIQAHGKGDGSLILFDTKTFEVYNSWKAHDGLVCYADFSPTGSKIVTTSSRDKSVKIWSSDGSLLFIIRDPTLDIHLATFSDDNKVLINYKNNTNKEWLLPPCSLLKPDNLKHQIYVGLMKKYLTQFPDGPNNYDGFIKFIKELGINLPLEIERDIFSSFDISVQNYLQVLLPMDRLE